MVTCTRQKAAVVNQLIVRALVEKMRKPVLGNLGLDWEANPDNFEESGRRKDGAPRPLQQEIYAGMRVHLTRNVNKRADFVNGMEATVRSLDCASDCLHVTTATGKDLALFPLTDDVEDGHVTCYPARPGYASNIHKLQGAELSHVTICWT